jgi:hypothetical protein
MVGSLTRVALARSGAGNSAEGTLVPFLLYRGLWAASTPGQGIGQIQQQACSIYMYLRASHTLFNDSLLHLWCSARRFATVVALVALDQSKSRDLRFSRNVNLEIFLLNRCA